jgi:hypothetical protein
VSKHQEQIIEGAKGKLDEPIIAAAFAKPRGATIAAASGGVIAREIGHQIAGKQNKGADAAGIEVGNPGAVAVTASSLLTLKVKVSFTGQIKEVTDLLSTVPLGAIDSLEVKRMGAAGVMEIVSGGASFKLEGKAGDMKEFSEAFERAKAAA